MAPLPERIGRYVVEREIGRGGMGVIYKAHDPDIDRSVALKLIRADLLSDADRADFITRFRREAQAAGRCAHANIVAVYDIGVDNGDPFMAMEFVQGATLAQAMDGGLRFSIGEAVAIILQVLAALGCAHENGVVHRDIKPANVLLLPGGLPHGVQVPSLRVKVMDFGIARLDTSELTQTGAIVGSPHYMSPEQCRGDHVDHRTDLFSTGTLLYQLLTGQKPFGGTSFTEVAYKLVYEDPPDLRDVLSNAPAALADVLRRAMAKRPADRFESAAAMAAALQGRVTEDPDTTLPIAGDAQTMVAPAMLASIERVLASHVGPIARTMVNTAARSARSAEVLCNTLSRSIADPVKRRAFLDEFRGDVAPVVAFSLSPEILANVERETAKYLGPIAKILIKRTLTRSKSMQEFRDGLAAHVEKDADRVAFLARLPKV